MNAQPSFDDLQRSQHVALVGNHHAGGESIDARFRRFHESNPQVYTGLVRLARELRRKGRGHWSVDALYHVLRWEWSVRTDRTDEPDFRLNDHFTSRYARLIMEREADLDGFFEIRSLHTA